MYTFRQLLLVSSLLLIFKNTLLSQTVQPKVLREFTVSTKKDDILHDVVECVDGCLLAVGETAFSNQEGHDVLLAKLDREGKQVFIERMGTSKNDVGASVAELPSGQILVAGMSHDCYGKEVEKGCPTTAWLRCRDAKGNRVWDKDLTKHPTSLKVSGILVDRMRNQVVITGAKDNYLWVCITDYDGNKLVERLFDRNLPDAITKLEIQKARPLLLNGAYYLYGGGNLNGKEEEMPYVVKLDAEATVLEAVSFPDVHATMTGQLSYLGDGWLGLTGAVQEGTSEDYFFIKLDTTLNKNTHKYQSLKSSRKDEIGAEVLRVEDQLYYLFGQFTSKTTQAAKSDFFVARLNAEGLALDEKDVFFKHGSSFSNKFEERALRLLRKTDNTIWLCGTRNNGNEFVTNFDFWFAQLETPKNLLEETLSAEIVELKPPIVHTELEDGSETPVIAAGASSYLRITIQNPNNQPLRGVTLTTTSDNAAGGFTWAQEITSSEIPGLSTSPIDIPLQVTENAAGATHELTTIIRDANGLELGRVQNKVVVKEKERAVLSLITYDWVAQSKSSIPTKGSPIKLKAQVKNTGTKNAEGFMLYWSVSQGVSFSGSDQSLLPILRPGETMTIVTAVVPPNGYIGNQLELKAFFSGTGESEEYSFVFPVTLAEAESPKIEAAVAETNSTSGSKPSEGFKLLVVWSSPNDGENISHQEVYEISAIGTSNKAALKVESFKVILNGDTLSFAGAKMDEVKLKTKQEDEEYTTYFNYKAKLTPGRNTIRVMVNNEYGIRSTKDELVVNYKAYDKGTLYVYSIGIPDPNGFLKYPEKDARDFAELVKNHRLFGEIVMQVFTGKDSTEAAAISSAVKQLTKDNRRRVLSEKDAVLVFISGHGYLDVKGNLRLMGSNYNSDDEKFTTIDFQEDLLATLEPLNCKKLVLVDACQGIRPPGTEGRKDSGEDDEYSKALDNLFQGSKAVRSVLSCSPGEYSWEDPAWENGAFTYMLKKALTDPKISVALDVNNDKGLSLGELFPYLQREVPDLVQKQKGKKITQTPSIPKDWEHDDVPFFVY